MAGEEFLKLFEQNWSKRLIFKKDKDTLNLKEVVAKVEDKEDEEEEEEEEEEAVKNFLVKRAMSDETMMMTTSSVSSSDDLFSSPRSVLTAKPSTTKLQTILSGKEVNEFSTLSETSEKEEQRNKKKSDVTRIRTRRGKSMSDLEYEELKGFIDLGFVFSEEDQRDSELVSILPGLQRLVKKEDVTEEEDISKGNRPYLSEAWDHCGVRKGKGHVTPAIKWKVPAAPEVKEVELKDHLKQWAHAVASTIR